MPAPVQPPEIRFWRFVEPGDPRNCWVWKGFRQTIRKTGNKGHGLFNAGNKRIVLAHRFIFEIQNGPIEDGMVISHRCDTLGCVNPGHLVMDTQRGNVADMIAKGRLAVGEMRWNARLSADKVRQIRAAVGTHEAIAAQFGVARPTISNIKSRKRWRHIK